MQPSLKYIPFWAFLLVFLGLALNGYHYVSKQSLWSPVDEMAHMDRIEKISLGKGPAKTTDTLENSIISTIHLNLTQPATGPDLTRQAMGIFNYSYEAQQPPVYYLLLAIPNSLLLKSSVPIEKRVILLRKLNYLLLILGLLCIIPLCTALNRLYPYPGYLWLGAMGGCIGLLTLLNQRYGLSNDTLSPLITHLSIIAFIRYRLNKKNGTFIVCLVLGILTLFTKYTNVLLTGMLAGLLLYAVLKEKSYKKLILVLVANFAAAALLAYLLWTRKAETNQLPLVYFQAILPPKIFPFKIFLDLIIHDYCNLEYIKEGWKIPVWMPLISALITILSTAVFLKTTWKKLPWIFISMGMMVCLLCMMYALHANIGGVHWYAFRHYSGYSIFLIVLYTGFITVIAHFINRRKRI